MTAGCYTGPDPTTVTVGTTPQEQLAQAPWQLGEAVAARLFGAVQGAAVEGWLACMLLRQCGGIGRLWREGWGATLEAAGLQRVSSHVYWPTHPGPLTQVCLGSTPGRACAHPTLCIIFFMLISVAV